MGCQRIHLRGDEHLAGGVHVYRAGDGGGTVHIFTWWGDKAEEPIYGKAAWASWAQSMEGSYEGIISYNIVAYTD